MLGGCPPDLVLVGTAPPGLLSTSPLPAVLYSYTMYSTGTYQTPGAVTRSQPTSNYAQRSSAGYPGRGTDTPLAVVGNKRRLPCHVMSQASNLGTGILPTRPRTTLEGGGGLERRRLRTLAPRPPVQDARDAQKRGSPADLSSLVGAHVSRFPSCPLVLESFQPHFLPPWRLCLVSRRGRACFRPEASQQALARKR
ncbi:uncharacterized protein LY79DRAFT_274140 [Colletotrichum navitas]|uniref:Uncharacterized protein n=1 Tax=Colletotrichum navitas TaxID=681940 RepID=A0AAD8PWR2_9PEZI|nr:uncharacterized protein LY79DRAFT_274140 [Colletotrichum navitas]KAK1585228.1 hypothetical protein LY79DRAFT_274140 [Colletotrichum navitas]